MQNPLFLGERTVLAERDLQLPRPPGVIRRFWARHPWVTDSLVAGIYLLLGVLGIIVPIVAPAIGPGDAARGTSVDVVAVRILVTAAMAAALLFRRHRPWAVLAVTWVGTVVGAGFDGTVDGVAIPLALYALAVYRAARDAWLGLAASVGVLLVATAVDAIIAPDPELGFGLGILSTTFTYAVTALLATLIGTNIGNRKRYVAALVDRAGQLARERDQQARLAVAAERSRIAREMHDIVSHSLTVMVTLAEGSAVAAAASPERASEAMRQVADTGRDALGDMRRMLGVLHSGDDSAPAGELHPQPGVADLPALIETFRSASLPLRFTSTGVPPEDPGVQLTTYRIVQEALTNTLRHATAVTAVEADVRYEPHRVTVTVTDDGRSSDEPGAPGHGLLGMRERVAVYSGSLESGPVAGRGWRVRAELPIDSGGSR